MRSTVFVVAMVAVVAAGVSFGTRAYGFEETVIQVRSMDDPDIPPDLGVCAEAPFEPNVLLGASLWSFQTRKDNGKVVGDMIVQVGTGTACALVTDLTFPPFDQAPMYVEFTVGDLTVTGNGVCTVTSNDVPQVGLILVGCALTVVDAPEGIAGGSLTSNSVFNPFGLPGFGTGSFWTVRLYSN